VVLTIGGSETYLVTGGSKTHLVTGDSEIVAAVLHYSSIKFTG
jgi:hypothetical protein